MPLRGTEPIKNLPMKFSRQCPVFSGVGLLLLLFFFAAGCATMRQQRAKKMPEVIEDLSSEDRGRIMAGEIAIGDSPEMVYLAWGRPGRKISIIRDDEELESWVYFGYRREYIDTYPSWHSFDRWYYDLESDHYVLFPSPSFRYPHTATYRVPYVRRRVEFSEGAVIAVEQLQQ